jgi:uncharacterized membrane protein YdjX (TVP38/TMEM64 family)
MSKIPAIKKIVIATWILFLIFCVGFYLTHREYFTPAGLAEFCTQFKSHILLVYLLLSLLRGFTLVPSTPFVLAGTMLFPAEPFWVLAISMTGIVFSSSMIYYFSEHLGFSEYLERKYPARIEKIHDRLQKPTGLAFVFLWSFFPLLPTDAVCYVAGILRMSFVKFILAMAFGEVILCSIYIFFYSYFADLFRSLI